MLRIPGRGDSIESKSGSPETGGIPELIRAAKAGDGEAFDGLARHFLPRLRRWALVRTGDSDEADDVVQGALVRAWSRIRSLESEAAIGVWLYRIIQTVAGERYRKKRSRLRALERLEREERRGGGESGHAGDEGELGALVRTFMDDLSARQRGMMDLVDLQGLSPAEAAAMLDLNVNTARVHLMRARRRIRARILEVQANPVEGS